MKKIKQEIAELKKMVEELETISYTELFKAAQLKTSTPSIDKELESQNYMRECLEDCEPGSLIPKPPSIDSKCVCGQEVCLGGDEVEIGGVCHRPKNPCYIIEFEPNKEEPQEIADLKKRVEDLEWKNLPDEVKQHRSNPTPSIDREEEELDVDKPYIPKGDPREKLFDKNGDRILFKPDRRTVSPDKSPSEWKFAKPTSLDWEKGFGDFMMRFNTAHSEDDEIKQFIRETIQNDRKKTIEWVKDKWLNTNGEIHKRELIDYLKQ